ncbi:acyl-[acyl-carrier-protein]--UDP-N-acetylglucosamine O-acyltransferase [Candidatus Aerophobetes bacterium]|uniref:Acyl-[acyl-carrier-protein]--UDP-N-acetylglucosamine O-acyltransferase n=1 Tax=Aerophobetes bacterium TaxID=2030807 RepID=A0A2A4YP34_UNCAE|nr:MAG: acyl-[acyl-carrier-protein]--UDP-N-acetylglucosamine O-acyltransferase [Candidatus Aerophobetes bacterium]
MLKIDPRAVIEEGAQIGNNVTIEPYAIIKKTVSIGDDCVIKSHAYIDGNTTIGKGTVIWPSASIGTQTQDLKFEGETTYVTIGENCHIREFVTINSSSKEGSIVKVGDNCLIMAYCHVAHNCEVGNHVVMSNNSMLAGHVIVEDYVVIGGMTPIHQFVRVGAHSMVGGFSRVTHDVPPYTIGAGVPYKLGGLNLIGLRRRGFGLEKRLRLSKAFKLTFRSDLHINEVLTQLEDDAKYPEIEHWIDFCKKSKRGFPSPQGTVNCEEDELVSCSDEKPVNAVN